MISDYIDEDDDDGYVGKHGRKHEAPVTEAPEKEAKDADVIADDIIIRSSSENGDDPYYPVSDDDMGYDIEFNTTIACLITNAKMTKSQANKLASILHDAYARSIKPVHGTKDGDTIFVLALGREEVNFDAFAALATDIMQYAVIDGATSAEAAYGLPAAKDMQ